MEQLFKIALLILSMNWYLNANADTVDNFQFKIRGQLVLNESGIGSALLNTNLFILKQSFRNEILTVTYFHCMRGNEDRKIKLKDSLGNIIRVWDFHPESARQEMGIRISEIINLIKSNSYFSLYYSDSQSKDDIFLTLIEINNKNYLNVIQYYKSKFQ